MHSPPAITQEPCLIGPFVRNLLALFTALAWSFITTAQASDTIPGLHPGPPADSAFTDSPLPKPASPRATELEIETKFLKISPELSQALQRESHPGETSKNLFARLKALCTGKAAEDIFSAPTLDPSGKLRPGPLEDLFQILNKDYPLDLLSTPRVTTPSGKPTSAELIWEYPTSYSMHPTPAPAPSPPQEYEPGVKVLLTPTLSPDQSRIDMRVRWQQTSSSDLIPQNVPKLAGDHPPVFSMQGIETSASLTDGDTLVLTSLRPDPAVWHSPRASQAPAATPAVVLAFITVHVVHPQD